MVYVLAPRDFLSNYGKQLRDGEPVLTSLRSFNLVSEKYLLSGACGEMLTRRIGEMLHVLRYTKILPPLFNLAIDNVKGQNKCQWLVIGSTELCGTDCAGDHYKIHLARLRQGLGTQSCMGCGRDVKNRFVLCLDCGYQKARMRAWQTSHRAFILEFKRLAAIEIFI